MRSYRNVVIAVAFVEFIAAGVIAGASANEARCDGAATKIERTAGIEAASTTDAASKSTYMICSDMPIACSP